MLPHDRSSFRRVGSGQVVLTACADVHELATSNGHGANGRSEELELLSAWRQPNKIHSLPEAHSSVSFPGPDSPWIWKLWAFAGVGFMVSVGYMDPGAFKPYVTCAEICQANKAGAVCRELGN